ncbi:NFASC-like protein [Mya arenaria]|uniref:NFASC-like protein n=1 Tax=Mya arenaria TaxID=6604 RepID=A0ABY7E6K8_MYAAR|nr:NFASC-like protein [Mya arenaria]
MKRNIKTLTFWYFLTFLRTYVPIRLATINPDVHDPMTVNEGDILRLICEAPHGIPAANISWYQDNKIDGFLGEDNILNSSKIEVIVNIDRTYTTKSTLTYLVSRGKHAIDHPVKPHFKYETNNLIITTNSISVIRNEEISIACIADGNPPPTYTWSTGHAGKILTTAFTSDTYVSCEVSNTLYPSGYQSNQASEDSNPPDTPVLWINSTCIKNSPIEQNVIRVLELDRVRVECVAAGNPEPTCQWTNHSQSCTLDITKASKEDKGTYVCIASNLMNTSYGSTDVGRNNSSFYLDILCQFTFL